MKPELKGNAIDKTAYVVVGKPSVHFYEPISTALPITFSVDPDLVLEGKLRKAELWAAIKDMEEAKLVHQQWLNYLKVEGNQKSSST